MNLPRFGGAVAGIGATLIALPLGFAAIPVAMAAAFGVKGILEAIERGKSRSESTQEDNFFKSNNSLSSDEILKLLSSYKPQIPTYRNNVYNHHGLADNLPGFIRPTPYFPALPQARERVQRVQRLNNPPVQRVRNRTIARHPDIRIDTYGQIFED